MSERYLTSDYVQQSFDFDEGEAIEPVEEVTPVHQVHEAFAPYIDVVALRDYAASGADLRLALRYAPELLPVEVVQVVETLRLLMTPLTREQVRSPMDIATLLMLDMGYLQQEQFRVVCLDTKNRIQKIHLVYQGSLNTAVIRVGEVFQEPIKLNSAAIIAAHNHPSGDPTPSPEDVLLNRHLVSAAKILDIDYLDHLVIAEGRYISMRERGLGFDH